MGRLAKCKGCGKSLKPEEKHMHNSKAYCEECYKPLERSSNEYKKLIDFVCANYNLDRPTGLMLKQIKEMKNDYKYSYAAMTYTLWYCNEILNKEFIQKYGVAMIRQYYDEAKGYYDQQEKLKEQMKKLKDLEIEIKVVRKTSNQKNSNSTLIDLGNLLKGGDTH